MSGPVRQPPEFASDYVGLQFKDQGRVSPAVDCWGLVRLVLKERRNIDLPLYPISEHDRWKVKAQIAACQQSGEWIRVLRGTERAFDVAEVTIPVKWGDKWIFVPGHVGILVAPGWLLHTERQTGSRLSAVDSEPMKNRILGFWRHRDLT